MRDFLLSEPDRAFRAELRDFLARSLAPRTATIEADGDWEVISAVVRALGEAGYLRLMFPDLYRGPLVKPGLTHATLLSEEAAYLNYAFETTIATALSCAVPLYRHGRPELRDRYLAGLLDGTNVGAICVTERNVGSDAAGMETTVRRDTTTNEWVVDGFKRYISNASIADVYVVYGITNLDAPSHRGMNCVAVPADAGGISFPRNYHFMGRRGSVVGEVAFADCRVPAENVLGEVGAGVRVMLGMFNLERILLGGAGLGVARSACDIAVAHAQARMAFGGRLSTKELVWDKIAEMRWRIDAAELLTYRAAAMFDAGADGRALMQPAAMAKLVASEAANFCADATVQILGGDGLTREYGRAEQIYRDARALTIVGGTTEIVKYVIARADLSAAPPEL
jgi:alkylation response protein AidB-like acyl-CoA dehydrogenase